MIDADLSRGFVMNLVQCRIYGLKKKLVSSVSDTGVVAIVHY